MVPLGSILTGKAHEGSELITRYNLYPAASIFGSAASGFSSGQALSEHGAAGRARPAAGYRV